MRHIRFLAALVLAALLFTSCNITSSVNNPLEWLPDTATAVVWVSKDATDANVAELESELRALDNIQSVEFMPKEETLAEFEGNIPEETFEALQGENNPLLDAFRITFVNAELTEQTVEAIDGLPYVDEITYSSASEILATYYAFPAPVRYLMYLYYTVFE